MPLRKPPELVPGASTKKIDSLRLAGDILKMREEDRSQISQSFRNAIDAKLRDNASLEHLRPSEL
jgi:hypothetical protein